jgi:hypothetical protein
MLASLRAIRPHIDIHIDVHMDQHQPNRALRVQEQHRAALMTRGTFSVFN